MSATLSQMAIGQAPPLPQIPNLLRPPGQPPTTEDAIMMLRKQDQPDEPPNSDDELPQELRRYAAGLRRTPVPIGAAWQQEIIYDKLGKDDSEIEGIAQYYFKAAQNYDGRLSSQRIEASQYYNGAPFGDEVDGRSQLVLTTVRDVIRSTLPSLLRVFTAIDDPVSFEPISMENAGDDKLATTLARQATDYARWAIFVANNGWTILHDAILDALTRKSGWVRWHWGRKEYTRTEVCEGLLLPQLQLLLSEPGIIAQRIIRRPMLQREIQALQQTPAGQMYLQQGGPPEYWSATLTRQTGQPWPIITRVPSECVWVAADADSTESVTGVDVARAVFHVRDVPASELIEAGLPEDMVLDNAGTGQTAKQRSEAIARDYASGANTYLGESKDKAMQNCRYAEGWIRVDADNDNRAELLHVHLIGHGQKLMKWQRTDEIPLACFTPYREPGRIIGLSQADMVMDIQKLESRVMRSVLDSLAQSMFPRTVMVLGQANQGDVRQTAIGSIIRVTQPGAVTELVKPFAGKEALPVLEVIQGIKESRTGITRASQGLTVDELQSTAPVAVSQQTSAAQDRLDMIARTLAETGLAPLYSGILRMLARQQDRPNTIRIRGQWISIDPRALATMWQTSVNVGGRGMPMERMALLAQIAQKQEQIMAVAGQDNPLVGIQEYRNTLARMLETASIGDVSSYFKQLPPGFQMPPQPQQPDPNTVLAQVQREKTSADLETDRARAQTERAKILAEDDFKRDQAALDAWAKCWVAAAQFPGTPAPAFTEFRAAMASQAPGIGLLQDLPPPTSPAPPATSAPQAPQQPNINRPPPLGRPLVPNPTNPAAPTLRPPTAPPIGSVDPATAQAVRSALVQGRLP